MIPKNPNVLGDRFTVFSLPFIWKALTIYKAQATLKYWREFATTYSAIGCRGVMNPYGGLFDYHKLLPARRSPMDIEITLCLSQLQQFQAALYSDEKSPATIQKYLHDVEVFFQYAQEQRVTKELVLSYKGYLLEKYAVSSANTMIVSINCFFAWMGAPELRVKTIKRQREIFRGDKELTKKEYHRLLDTAQQQKKFRLKLIMETICATGIRVSELRHITVEAIRSGTAKITCKGKHRLVLLPKKLCGRLKEYCHKKKIKSGSIFITKNGSPLDRSNIWSAMKKLCKDSGVAAEKIFPHNLRHLFARLFLTIEKDITKLADILGHTSLNTTRIYTLSNGAEHRRRMNQLARVLLF